MTCLIKFELAILMILWRNYLRQDLYMNLIKTVQCTQRMKRDEKEWSCSKWFTWWTLNNRGDEKIPDNCKYPLALIETAQNQKQTNTGGLAKSLKLKIGAKVMLTINIDIQDCLIKDQTGNTRHIEFSQGTVYETYVKFSDEQAGLKRWDHLI